jgi:hypothetical protein
MKLSPLLLTVSLAANIALLVAYAKFGRADRGVATPGVANVDPDKTGASGAIGSEKSPSKNTGAEKSQATPRHSRSWTEIETDDFDELARRLKAAGLSAHEIRAIMAMRISEKFQYRQRGSPYWRSEYRDYNDPKVQEAQAAAQVLYQKHVYGPTHLADDPEQLESAQRRFGPLPSEKLQRLATIEMELMQQTMSLNRGGATDPEAAHAAYLKLEKEKEARVKEALTPEEYALYELRASAVANQLRYRLEPFQPSEAEYQTLFAIQKSFYERISDPKLTGEARQALESEMMNHVTSALGPERALDYQESMRGGDETSRLIAALGLPARVGGQIRTMREDFAERAQTVRTNGQLSPAERAAQLAGLAAEARTKLHGTLGPEGFEAYNDLKGDWIRALEKNK